MPKPYFKDVNISEMIRVNHAGEYGAKRIYQGQIRFAKTKEDKQILVKMLEHEQEHLDYFTNLIYENNVRATVLLPLWHHTGYALGAASSICGIRYAMLLTECVEEVIEDHYNSQVEELNENNEMGLAADIQKFMDDEVMHKSIAREYNKEPKPVARIASFFIKKLCKSAIFLSKRI